MGGRAGGGRRSRRRDAPGDDALWRKGAEDALRAMSNAASEVTEQLCAERHYCWVELPELKCVGVVVQNPDAEKKIEKKIEVTISGSTMSCAAAKKYGLFEPSTIVRIGGELHSPQGVVLSVEVSP